MTAPRIAVIGVPLQGHVRPVLPLLKAMSDRGYSVHYYNTPKFKWVAEETGALFVPYRSLLETHPHAHPALIFLHREIPNAVSQLEDRLLQRQYDLLLYDSFCTWTKYLAVKYRLPAGELFTTYPNSRAREVDPDRTVYIEDEDASLFYIQRYNLSPYVVDYRTRKHGPKGMGLYDLRLVEAAIKTLGPDCYDGITADKVIDTPARLNLVFLPEEFLSIEPDKPGASYHFLPSLYLLKPLKQGDRKKRIYASFGTRSRTIEQLIVAWLKDPAAGTGKLHVAAGGEARLLQHYACKNVIIERFVDQHALLSEADAFITHGGMNGVMESILTETPMLVIPLTMEQQITANNIVRFKLGISCPLSKLKTMDLHHVVTGLMSDTVIRENLKNWRTKIINAGGVERALALIGQCLETEAGAQPDWSEQCDDHSEKTGEQ